MQGDPGVTSCGPQPHGDDGGPVGLRCPPLAADHEEGDHHQEQQGPPTGQLAQVGIGDGDAGNLQIALKHPTQQLVYTEWVPCGSACRGVHRRGQGSQSLSVTDEQDGRCYGADARQQ